MDTTTPQETEKMKLKTIYVATDLNWSRPEWADEGSEAEVAEAAGYVFEIGPSPIASRKYDWLVKVTAEISETPEVIGTGTSPSRKGAIWQAGLCANADQKVRGKGQAVPAPVPVPEPAQGPQESPGEMLDAVEDELAAAMGPKPRKRKQAPALAPIPENPELEDELAS